jgi:hypothetical protein
MFDRETAEIFCRHIALTQKSKRLLDVGCVSPLDARQRIGLCSKERS